jgi:GT2 family glycosyltransferase
MYSASRTVVIGDRESMIAAVVPTHNRKDLLRRSIARLLGQSRPLDGIIVVDNGSTDTTLDMLHSDFPDITVLALPENTGPAGGYARGLKMAYQKGYDWIWIVNDDAIPRQDALEELFAAMEVCSAAYEVGVLASMQWNPTTQKLQGGRLWKDRIVKPPEAYCSDHAEPYAVDLVDSTSSLINRHVVEEVGLPREEFWGWFDDYEYCLRIRAEGYTILTVPTSVVEHEPGRTRAVKLFGQMRAFPSLAPPCRHYYEARNLTYVVVHERRSYKAFLYLLWRHLVWAAAILFFDDAKAEKLQMRARGVLDGLRGRLGRKYV